MLASALALVFFLCGAGYLLTYILESSAYFRVEIPQTVTAREGLSPDKEEKIKGILRVREEEREKLKQGVIIDPEGKNPFNWP